MALTPNDLKKGTLFTLSGEPYKVLDYSQKVMGRGSSVVSVRARSLREGKIIDKTFKGSEDIGDADVVSSSAEYLYSDDNYYYFMNQESFEQHEIGKDIVGDSSRFLKEGQKVSIQLFEDRPINIELPKNVWLEVKYTEPAVKGDTTSSITKDAQLETGATVKVPVFIKNGDVISVDTESGDYRERQK